MFATLKAIGAVIIIGVLWIAIPIAGVITGIVFASCIAFLLLFDHFKDDSEEK